MPSESSGGVLRHLELAGTHFRRQATIGPYFADFACHARRLIVEVDGSQHAEAANILTRRAANRVSRSKGYRVLRFWNNDVLKEIDSVMEAIYSALHEPVSSALVAQESGANSGGEQE
jgi:very-short-patch-repair endonuclease